MIPLISIEGPTASGKTALALELANKLSTVIISADSRQVYRGLDIGTAKPSPDELEQVKHYLIDIIDPADSYNAGRFVKDSEQVIHGLHTAGKIPIVCGGTGLYIRSLLKGLFSMPDSDPALRASLKEELSQLGIDKLYQKLQTLDPKIAEKISCNDSQRILRALEVYYITGKPLSKHWEEQDTTSKYKSFRILLNPPRQTLYQRIDHRLDIMLSRGLIEEIKQLLSTGVSQDSPGMNTLGYKEFLPYLSGAQSLDEGLDKAKQHSRNYAKRQVTWYRKCEFDFAIITSSFTLSDINSILSLADARFGTTD